MPTFDNREAMSSVRAKINAAIEKIDDLDTAEVVTPQMYGALGNDTGDDTAALQAAINACKAAGTTDGSGGKRLYIPPGTYRHTGLTVDRPITIEGAGGRRTRLRKIGNGTAPSVMIAPAHDGVDYVASTSLFANIKIKGIHLIGAGKDNIGGADGWRIQNATTNPIYTEVVLEDISAWAHAGNGLKGQTFAGPVRIYDINMSNNNLCGAEINSCVDWRIFGGEMGSNELDSLQIAGCVQMRIYGLYVYSGGRFSANLFNSQVMWHGGAIDASATHGLNYDCRREFDYCKFIDVDFRKNGFNSSPNTYADIYVSSLATSELYLQNCGFEYPNNGSSLYNIQFQGSGNYVYEAGSRFEGGDVNAANVTNAPNQLRSVGRHLYSKGDRNYSTLATDVVTSEQYTGLRLVNDFVPVIALYGTTGANAGGVLDIYQPDGIAVGQRIAAPGTGVPSLLNLPGPYDDDTAALAGGVTSGCAYRQTGGGVAYVGGGASGGSINANTAYASRSAAEAATIPPTQNALRWYDGGALLEAKREPSVITRPCITTNGGAVYWSPVGQIEAAHYGIVPGTVANGRIEYATLDAASRGQRLYFRGSATPYTVTDTHIFHCRIYGDGASGKWSTGIETVIQTSGAGTARQWHDKGTGTPADDMSRPVLVAGRSELSIADIRIDNAADWEHDILFPATRACVVWKVTTGGASSVSVVFDQTWSDRNTTLKTLHPTIVPGAGCNECMTFDCDLGGDVEGLGIIGTVRNPDDYTGTDWWWGWGGASDFHDVGSRITGAVLNAACDNGAGMVQGILFSGTAFRVGGRERMLTIDRATRVIIENSYAEASDGDTAYVDFTSRTAANWTQTICFKNCNWIRNNVRVDGVVVGGSVTSGNSGMPFLDTSDTLGNRWAPGMVYGANGMRPVITEGASLGTSSYQFLNIRGRRFRSLTPDLWFRTLQDGVTTPRICFSVGNSNIRVQMEKGAVHFFKPGITVPSSDDAPSVDPEDANNGVTITPTGIFPVTDRAVTIGSTSKAFLAVRATTMYPDEIRFGAATGGGTRILRGTGSPEGVVTAPPPAIYFQEDAGGAVSGVWEKRSGTGNTGWISLGESEGTWTPTIIGSTTPGTQTYAQQLGAWVKRGTLVTCQFRVALSALDPAAAGNAVLGGLPFPVASKVANLIHVAEVASVAGVTAPTGHGKLGLQFSDATSTASIITSSLATVTSLAWSGVGATAQLRGQFSYRTTS